MSILSVPHHPHPRAVSRPGPGSVASAVSRIEHPVRRAPWAVRPDASFATSLAATVARSTAWRRETRLGSAPEEQFPAERFQELQAAGLLLAPLAPALGGFGLGFLPGTMGLLLDLLRHIGRGDLVIGRIYEGHVNAAHLMQKFGSTDQIQAFREALALGHVSGVWNAEIPSEGLKVQPLPGARWRLEGWKTFCSGAGHVLRPFVHGTLPDGRNQMCCLSLDRQKPRVDADWWQPVGMKGTLSHRIDFTGLEVGPEALIGQPEDYHVQPWFSAGAMRFLAVQLGGAEALYDEGRSYLARLGRGADLQQQLRFGELAATLEGARLVLRQAAAEWDGLERGEGSEVVDYVAMARGVIERACEETMTVVQRAVGARGLMTTEPFERMVRDLTMYLRQPAPDAASRRVGEFVLAERPDVPVSQLWRTAS